MIGGRGGGEVQPEHLDEHQLRQPGRDDARARVRRRTIFERVVDARLDPSRRRARRHAHDERGREDAHCRIEQRVGRVEVAADDVGAFAAAAVTDDRKHAPRRCVHQLQHRDAIRRRRTADVVSVSVGDHDDITGAGPVPFAVVARDPTRPARDDVEDDQPFGTRMERAGGRRSARIRRRTLRSIRNGRRSHLRGGAVRVRAATPRARRSSLSHHRARRLDPWRLGQPSWCLGHSRCPDSAAHSSRHQPPRFGRPACTAPARSDANDTRKTP